ncbi:MAG: YkgJ family cysteine cluster protein [Ginsengibacter sp.]|jgi:hypothetical protein
MLSVNLKKHKKKFDLQKRSLRYFITRFENNPPKNFNKIVVSTDQEVWSKIDCLGCANCCKVMSPTYTNADILRISKHLGMKPKEFKEKWLYLDKRENDWMNRSRPCQFLDLETNKCTIYEVRPKDCAQFPHLARKPVLDYFYIHKQNIEYCPATMLFVEKLQEKIKKPI